MHMTLDVPASDVPAAGARIFSVPALALRALCPAPFHGCNIALNPLRRFHSAAADFYRSLHCSGTGCFLTESANAKRESKVQHLQGSGYEPQSQHDPPPRHVRAAYVGMLGRVVPVGQANKVGH